MCVCVKGDRRGRGRREGRGRGRGDARGGGAEGEEERQNGQVKLNIIIHVRHSKSYPK